MSYHSSTFELASFFFSLMRMSSRPVCRPLSRTGPLQQIKSTALPPACHIKISRQVLCLRTQANRSAFPPHYPFGAAKQGSCDSLKQATISSSSMATKPDSPDST